MNDNRTLSLLEELSEERQPLVTLAIAYADNTLPAAEAGEVRRRLDTDMAFRAVALPVIEAVREPPLDDLEYQRQWADFRRRIGIATPMGDSGYDPAYHARIERRDRSFVRWRFVKIAAVIIATLIALPFAAVTVLQYRYMERYSTPGNATETINLPDGSLAQLGPSTRLSTLRNMRSGRGTFRRELWLWKGVATLHVAHNASTRFIVFTETARVTAIGTRFTVRVAADTTDVSVTEGKVSVQPLGYGTGADAGNPRELIAGQSARVTASEFTVAPMPPSGGRP